MRLARELADRIVRFAYETIHYTEPLVDPDDPFDAEVRVTLTDGQTFAAKVDRPHGRRADDPIPFEQLQAKFEHCARLVVSRASAAAAAAMIAKLENVASVRSLTGLLEPIREVTVSTLVHA